MFYIISATRSTRNIMFQYKLLNRFLATNKYLKTINIKDEDSCTFCKNQPETIAHMFWYCPRVQSFINDIKNDILREYRIELNINRKTWFFSANLSAMETCILVLAKMVVYEARLKESYPSITHLKNKLKAEIQVEHYAALLANKQDKFEKKWGPLKDVHRRTT